MSEHRVNPELLHRTASGKSCLECTPESQYLWLLPGGKSCGQFYLATCITGMSVVHTDNNAGI